LDAVLATDVIERADVGMGELRDCFRLPLEALPHLLALGKVRGQNLDRDRAFEPGVPGFVDLSHPACADSGENLVGSKTRARGEGHLRSRPAVQFRTSVIGVDALSPSRVLIRNFWPSAETS